MTHPAIATDRLAAIAGRASGIGLARVRLADFTDALARHYEVGESPRGDALA
jgi:hypothetical protein